MTELAAATRTVPVHIKNATWVTEAQLKERFAVLQQELDISLAAVSLQLDNLIDEVEIQEGVFTSAGQHLDMHQGNFGYITLAVDGDGEDFEANVVVLYQARQHGEFIPVKLLGSDGVAVSEASSKSALYKVLAPQGQTIRAVAAKYNGGNVHVRLSASSTGSY